MICDYELDSSQRTSFPPVRLAIFAVRCKLGPVIYVSLVAYRHAIGILFVKKSREEVNTVPSLKLFSACLNYGTHQKFLHILEVPITHLGEDRPFQATVLESPAYPHSVTLSYTTWESTRSACFNSRHTSSSSTSRRFLLNT